MGGGGGGPGGLGVGGAGVVGGGPGLLPPPPPPPRAAASSPAPATPPSTAAPEMPSRDRVLPGGESSADPDGANGHDWEGSGWRGHPADSDRIRFACSGYRSISCASKGSSSGAVHPRNDRSSCSIRVLETPSPGSPDAVAAAREQQPATANTENLKRGPVESMHESSSLADVEARRTCVRGMGLRLRNPEYHTMQAR